MSKNEKLYDRAVDAIHHVFSDLSVSRLKVLSNLQDLKDEINVLMDTLILKDED